MNMIDPDQVNRILALIPSHKRGAASARYTFLGEELTAFAGRGITVHTVSPYVTHARVIDGVRVHPIPRIRSVGHTVRSAALLLDSSWRCCSQSASFVEKLRLARYHRAISTVVKRQRIDLIYSPFAWPSGTAGVAAARRVGVPVVVSLRGADVLVEESIQYGACRDPYYRARISKALSEADYVIGVSRALADCAVALGASPDRVGVLLKGVDRSRFHPGSSRAARLRLGLPDRPTVLFVGNFLPCKGLNVLLDAFHLVRTEMPNACLVLCGDGREQQNLQMRVRQEGLQSCVSLPGRVERDLVPEYFRACDVFVLPSLTEGSGNVLVEAGACGRPVIGSNVAGIPDYIDDGITGFLFEKGNARDLSAKILSVLRDKQLAARMGAMARDRVERQHTYDHMLDQLLAIFRRVIHGRQTSAASSLLGTPPAIDYGTQTL